MLGRRTTAMVASAALLVGGTGAALAHGGGFPGLGGPGGPGGHGRGGGHALSCEIPAAQLLTAAESPALARVKARLDAAVAADRVTQARADDLFEAARERVTLMTARRDAELGPLLEALGMTREQFEQALEDGLSPQELAEIQGVSRSELRAAMREGREAARDAVDALCGEDDEG